MSRAPPVVRVSHTGFWLVGFVVLVGAVAAVLVVGGARSATNAAGVIAFTRADGIYVMQPDGSGVRPLRRAQARQLDWSPDGRRLAFDSDGSLWVIGADGKGLRRFVSAAALQGQAHSPTWSADGRRVAFSLWTAKHTKDKEIWVVNADGSNLRRLVRLPGLGADNRGCAGVGTIDWSPDGRRIALNANCSWLAWIYVVNTDGSKLRNLTRSPKGVIHMPWAVDPHWSPDSSRIAFEQWPPDPTKSSFGDADSEIYVIDVDSGAQVRLTNNRVRDNTPVWSPDGRKIAFVHGLPWGTSQIYVVNADGTGLKRLTQGANPAWQPVATPQT